MTQFNYSAPVCNSEMRVRMQPRDDGIHLRLSSDLSINPQTQITFEQDSFGNMVHHFTIPGEHSELIITAQALVELVDSPPLPAALDLETWSKLDRLATDANYKTMLAPSHFAHPTDLLGQLADELQLRRHADPLTVLRDLTTKLHNTLAYVQYSTTVDSPIDEALQIRQGVCQDFAHIMITLGRGLGIPCRYVSGYLFYPKEKGDRIEMATHAWVEALLPELGWVGFDPTNNSITNDRYIKVAVGRDYYDVPPTRGTFIGDAQVELSVAVKIDLVREMWHS